MDTTIQRIITPDSLCKRWRRHHEWLERFCLHDYIETYRVKFKDTHKDGSAGRVVTYYVEPGYYPGMLGYDATVFDLDEVERIEQERPDVIAPPPAVPVAPALPAAWRAPQAVPLPWGGPPQHSPAVEPANAKGGSRVAELEAQLAQARQENERLTQEVERLKAGINEQEGSLCDCEDCPAKMKIEKRLEVFRVGVRMAIRCAGDGEPQSKDGHLALWRELHGERKGKPHSRYFDAFRQALDEAPHLKHPDPKEK